MARIKMSKEDKQAVREARKHIRAERKYEREERKYGDIYLRALAEHDCEVMPYYRNYKGHRRQSVYSMYWAFFWVALSAIELLLACFSENPSDWTIGIVTDMLLAMYWLNSSRIEETRADHDRLEVVIFAKQETTEKVARAIVKLLKNKEVKNGNSNLGEKPSR